MRWVSVGLRSLFQFSFEVYFIKVVQVAPAAVQAEEVKTVAAATPAVDGVVV